MKLLVVLLAALCVYSSVAIAAGPAAQCTPGKCSASVGAECKSSDGAAADDHCGFGLACVNDKCMKDGTNLPCDSNAICGSFDMVNLIRGKPVLVCFNKTCQPAGFVNDKCLGSRKLCVGAAHCDKTGVCQGVKANGTCMNATAHASSFDDCAPGLHCNVPANATSGKCTAYLAKGANCSANGTLCSPDLFCNAAKGGTCQDKYANKANQSCSANVQCNFGLFCVNGTCMASQNISKPCTDIGGACTGTVPASQCMCVAEFDTPMCYVDDETRGLPPPNSCTNKAIHHTLECAVAHGCFVLDHGDGALVQWVGGSCFNTSCSANDTGYEACFCDYTNILNPTCNAVEDCKAPPLCPPNPKCSDAAGSPCVVRVHATSNDTVCGAGLVCVDHTCQYNGTGVHGNCSGVGQVYCNQFNPARVERGDPLLQCITENNASSCREVAFPSEPCSPALPCVGNAVCTKGKCVGVQVGNFTCNLTPFDDCEPSAYCNGTGNASRCVEYVGANQNCTGSARCAPPYYCDSKNTCVAFFAQSGGNCSVSSACQPGLLCINRTCQAPKGVGENCSHVGHACNGTDVSTMCLCEGTSQPTCVIISDPSFPPPESCQGDTASDALACAWESGCYMYPGWVGECFKSKCKTQYKATAACMCDTLAADAWSCGELRACHKKSSSSKMPVWELAVIIVASVIGGVILLAVIAIVVLVFMFGGTFMNKVQQREDGYMAVN